MYPNRTMCDALEEMRACFKTYNFAPILGLIEEVQSMGNRMEAALGDKKEIRDHSECLEKLDKEHKELLAKVKALRSEAGVVESDAEKDMNDFLYG